ncbi:hypothetical protein SAMN05216464_11817 [Mucilaginibacter pineti]|uniref:Uncharacterized protein n=1 Tax=Mucilaginibacter pineti TaxID=1391627 RepID=A0A1G7L2U7_9SPHI|nr:hypothetical protein SAMN05216464_11817 [Mucilaginibacter pineti]
MSVQSHIATLNALSKDNGGSICHAAIVLLLITYILLY